jgi:hypothetical protein
VSPYAQPAATPPIHPDTTRLNWLEGTLARVAVETDDGDGPIAPEWSVRGDGGAGLGGSLRAAIDSAMDAAS